MNNQKKILLFSDCYLFGGSEYLVVNLLKNHYLNENYAFFFAYRRHRLYTDALKQLFSIDQIHSFYALLLFSNVNLFYRFSESIRNKMLRRGFMLPFYLIERLGIYRIINRFLFYCLLKKVRPDLIHINNGGYPAAETCLELALVARKLGIKVVMQVSNIAQVTRRKSERKKDEKVDRAVSSFITASQYAKNILSLNRGFRPEKIKVIHNAVECVSPDKSREQVFVSLGLSPDKILLVEVALLQERKGQLPLLQSLVLLRDTDPLLFGRIVLLFIGTGEDESKIREYICVNALEQTVLMLGYKFDHIDYVNAADIVMLPSVKDEDMPLIILSAMSLGKSIISTTIAGIPEEIEDGVSGYLVRPDTEGALFASALQEAIRKTIRNCPELGRNAKEKFEKDFSMGKYTERIDELYAALCR